MEEESKREKREERRDVKNVVMEELEIERVIRKNWQMDTLLTFTRFLFPIRPHESFTHQFSICYYYKFMKNTKKNIAEYFIFVEGEPWTNL